jgi:hypothetical protein
VSACEFLQVHSHELEPDPAPDEIINEVSQVDDTIVSLQIPYWSMQLKGAILVHSLLEILDNFCLRIPNVQPT